MGQTSRKPYQALKTSVPALREVSARDLCTAYIEGLCQKTTCTPAAHQLFRIKEDPEPAISARLVAKNTLYRTGADKEFENDGPGTVSLQGPRHDNDHVDIPNIKVLPTMDEILSQRSAYMPRKSKAAFHHHSNNPVKRYIDIQFRQLRYECTASVTDACVSGFRLATAASKVRPDFRQETTNGSRYYWFENVRFEMSMFNEQSGAKFQLSYDCPEPFRGPRKMAHAPFLKEGMLCALLAVHEETHELNVVFLQVHQSQGTEAMRSKTGCHNRAAVQVVLADADEIDKVAQLACYHRGQMHATFFLVDIPSVLVASFLSHLKVLQALFADERFAFKEYLSADDPTAAIRNSQGVYLPAPAKIAKDSLFNLNSLRKDRTDRTDLQVSAVPLNSSPDKNLELRDVKQRSILDDGQAMALFESLKREIAFTQGPPGTGKTFLGVALAETILASREYHQKHPPILVVCQTNHALDDFLEELLKRGVRKITRLGGGSTAKWIGPYLLRNQRSKRHLSCKEISSAGRHKHQTDFLHVLGADFAEALNEKVLVPWTLMESYMIEQHIAVYKHFTTLDMASTQQLTRDIRAAKMRRGFAFMYWQEGGDIKDANDLITAFENMLGESQLTKEWGDSEVALLREELAQGFQAGIDLAMADSSCHYLWSLDQESRQHLANCWLAGANPKASCEAFGELHRRFRRVKRHRRAGHDEQDAATILELEVEILGMTSTACATMRPLLQKVAPQVIIFEEASELIETHSTIALVPSVEHCIQIGDPLQLRPHVEQTRLSTEHSNTYRLDESLLERFMNAKVPFSQLNTQRRAHPEIADLLRVGDYPYLMDHPNTLSRPVVAGMKARLWWVDHKHPEDSVDRLSALSKSASNQYEVKFVAAMVRYLVEKQNYKFREITVLTPYKGQLVALQKDLSQICSVSLTEGDRNELIDAALIEDHEVAGGTSVDIALSDMLRIATIDNYQGEQARVIIFSAVRSNSRNSMGFLANHNRRNVAISRAEDGFYVIGNATLMERNEHWQSNIQCFREKGAIGQTITAQCHHHPHNTHLITNPVDFQHAVCVEQCNRELRCGHICKAPCHLQDMHQDGRMPCLEQCAKMRDCGHACNRVCSQRCGPCTVATESITINCGHPAEIKCGEKIDDIICTVALDSVKLDCGHLQPILCSDDVSTPQRRCSELCATMLPCGHQCPSKCSECRINKDHPQSCNHGCSRTLGCGHTCQELCHPGECPPCEHPCKKYCQHGHCQHPCHQTCKICVDLFVDESCPHAEANGTTNICCLPTLSLPCSESCPKLLACGVHACPSLCGEVCPQSCDECLHETNRPDPTITLACGHTFPVQELDEKFGLHNNYAIGSTGTITGIAVKRITPLQDLCCPDCSTPVPDTRRYALSYALPTLSGTIFDLIALCAKKLCQSHWEINMGEQILFAGLDGFLANLKTGPMCVTANQYAIGERCRRLIDAQQHASQHVNKCIYQIEGSIQALCASLNNQEMFPTPSLGFRLRCDLLYYLSRLALIEFAHRIAAHFANLPSSDLQNRLLSKGYTSHAVEQAAGECLAIQEKITACTAMDFKRLEVEMRLVQLCLWNILRAHKATDKVDLDVSTCLARMQYLTDCYPRSAGLFEMGYRTLRNSIGQKCIPPRFYSFCSERTNEIWHRFADYKAGDLTACRCNHVYSQTAFPKGCPECGPEIHPVIPESYDQKNVISTWKGAFEPIDANAFVAQVEAVAFTLRT